LCNEDHILINHRLRNETESQYEKDGTKVYFRAAFVMLPPISGMQVRYFLLSVN